MPVPCDLAWDRRIQRRRLHIRVETHAHARDVLIILARFRPRLRVHLRHASFSFLAYRLTRVQPVRVQTNIGNAENKQTPTETPASGYRITKSVCRVQLIRAWGRRELKIKKKKRYGCSREKSHLKHDGYCHCCQGLLQKDSCSSNTSHPRINDDFGG